MVSQNKRAKLRGKAKHKFRANKNTYNRGKIYSFIYIIILLIAFFKVYPYIFDEKLDLNGDNTDYYSLGAAISQGEGYVNIMSVSKSPANKYPPGYPFIVGITMKVFSNDIITIKKLNGFFLLASIIVLFFLFYTITGNVHLAFVFSLLLLLNTNILQYSTIMMSEISFLFFSILGLYFLIKLDDKKPLFRNWVFFLLLLSIVISYYIRTAGLSLFGGTLLVFLLKKNWKYLIGFVGGFVVLALPWYLRGQKLGGNSYMSALFWKNPYRTELGKMEFFNWFDRIYKNFERYITHEIPSGCLNFINVKYTDSVLVSEWIVGIIILCIIIYGLVKLNNYKLVIFSYLLGSFGIMMLWPDVWFGTRFLLPIIPLLLFLIGSGIYEALLLLMSKLKIKNNSFTVLVLPFSFLLFIPFLTPQIDILHQKAKNTYPNSYKNYFELATWVKTNTPDDAIVSCRKPSFFYLFSSRHVTGYANTLDKEKVVESMITSSVDYVVLDQLGYSSTGRYLYPAIKRYPLKFKIVKHLKNPDTYLMEFRPEFDYWGEWENDKRNGTGSYTWENGNKYQGNWKDDLRNGSGTMMFANGDELSGTWKDDKMNGDFILKSQDGEIKEKSVYKENTKIRIIN